MAPVTPVRTAIAQSGLTQKEVAAAAGLSESRMSHIAHGLHPSEQIKARVADALGRPVSDLWPTDAAEDVAA